MHYAKMTSTGLLMWDCPGCNEAHGAHTKQPNPLTGAKWQFNGDFTAPTLTPSVHVKIEGKTKCHCFITSGIIHFLDDCDHNLKGQAVPMLPWD